MQQRASALEPVANDRLLTLNIALTDGGRFTAPAATGFRVMELIRAYGFPIKAECGGSCVCSTCHVRIGDRWRDALPPPSDEELAKLDEIPRADEASRLACQLVMTDDLDGLEVEVQPDSLVAHNWVAG